MAAKKRNIQKTGTKNNQLFIFIAIIIVLAVVSIVTAYLLMDNDKEEVVSPTEQETTADTKMVAESVAQIAGTWVSNYDGVMLTIEGLTFSIESSGVDVTAKITGKLSVEGNIVTFVYESGNEVCKSVEGHYLYSIEENGDLFFKLIKDTCPSRQERMSVSWFKL